jgi:hypothetical protein
MIGGDGLRKPWGNGSKTSTGERRNKQLPREKVPTLAPAAADRTLVMIALTAAFDKKASLRARPFAFGDPRRLLDPLDLDRNVARALADPQSVLARTRSRRNDGLRRALRTAGCRRALQRLGRSGCRGAALYGGNRERRDETSAARMMRVMLRLRVAWNT